MSINLHITRPSMQVYRRPLIVANHNHNPNHSQWLCGLVLSLKRCPRNGITLKKMEMRGNPPQVTRCATFPNQWHSQIIWRLSEDFVWHFPSVIQMSYIFFTGTFSQWKHQRAWLFAWVYSARTRLLVWWEGVSNSFPILPVQISKTEEYFLWKYYIPCPSSTETD